ncbi:spore germination protein [Pontibacillus salicampi]|uniref:Spore germination protein n=1 Tax=Pontibacillus salicampi TaxID=1449801 RepID=A0ABV6LLN7_9BACI
MRVLNKLFPKRKNKYLPYMREEHEHTHMVEATKSLKKNIDLIMAELHYSEDIKIIFLEHSHKAVVYIESLVDQEKMQNKLFIPQSNYDTHHLGRLPNTRHSEDINEVIYALLSGSAVYIEDGEKRMAIFTVTSSHNRKIQEPDSEKVLRGAHEGFIESIMVNINLVRKRIQNRDLVVKYYRIGKKMNSNMAVMYMDGIASPKNIKELERRLKAISMDAVLSPGFLEELIEDNSMSPFPQMLNTERPDSVAANIMEGRIGVFLEGSSTCLILPVTFFAFYQSPDDYNSRWISSTFVRLLRLMSFIIAIGLPSFYIAVVGFHFEVIPDPLVIPIKSSINNIAYPPILEALVMVVIIELIRESGIRLPSPIGQTIGIVGGLVIGDAVVRAGLVSNLMIIIVALTAIASFVVPSNELSNALRLLTFPLILLASTLGFLGIVFGFLFLLIHLIKLKSFGTAYLAPVAPFRARDVMDTFIRLPLFLMNKRPKDAAPMKEDTGGRSREWKKNER